MKKRIVVVYLLCVLPVFAELAGVAYLPEHDDRSGAMLAGIDRFLTSKTAQVVEERAKFWQRSTVTEQRARLRQILGADDPRLFPVRMELVGDLDASALAAETSAVTVQRVRWPVHEDSFGEGLLVTPKNAPPRARGTSRNGVDGR